MAIDAFPESNHEQLKQHISNLLADAPDKIIKNSLHGLIEERYLLFILENLVLTKILQHIIYLISN